MLVAALFMFPFCVVFLPFVLVAVDGCISSFTFFENGKRFRWIDTSPVRGKLVKLVKLDISDADVLHAIATQSVTANENKQLCSFRSDVPSAGT